MSDVVGVPAVDRQRFRSLMLPHCGIRAFSMANRKRLVLLIFVLASDADAGRLVLDDKAVATLLAWFIECRTSVLHGITFRHSRGLVCRAVSTSRRTGELGLALLLFGLFIEVLPVHARSVSFG